MYLKETIESLVNFCNTVCPNAVSLNTDCKIGDRIDLLQKLELLIDELQAICTRIRLNSESGNMVAARMQASDDSLVQIKAGKAEIDRRIAAFIEHKQTDIDDSNKKEFCNFDFQEGSEDSCARTNAVFVARSDCKSHVKVSKVVNTYGPQTRQLGNGQSVHRPSSLSPSSQQVSSALSRDTSQKALDERLVNMETHMKCTLGKGASASDVYERIKNLENRILFLESVSPEYFNVMIRLILHTEHDIKQLMNCQLFRNPEVASDPKLNKKQRIGDAGTSKTSFTKSHFDDMSVREIDERIKHLQSKLNGKG